VILASIGIPRLYKIVYVPKLPYAQHIEKCLGSLKIGPTEITITSIIVPVEVIWES